MCLWPALWWLPPLHTRFPPQSHGTLALLLESVPTGHFQAYLHSPFTLHVIYLFMSVYPSWRMVSSSISLEPCLICLLMICECLVRRQCPMSICPVRSFFFFFFVKDFIYLFLKRGREGEERNSNMCLPLVHPPTEGLSCNPGMCSDWESNQQPFGSQAGAQSTEPHQPGLSNKYF